MPLGPSWDIQPLPSHEPTSKKKVPNIPLYDEVKDPDVGPAPVMPVGKNYHPVDVSKGLLERFIEIGGRKSGALIDDDMPYFEQWMHGDRDIIPKQPLRPGRMKDPPDVEFRRLPNQVPNSSSPNFSGLGSSRATEGKDYSSVYDLWDFNTNARLIGNEESKNPLTHVANWAAKKFLQNVGTPFAVYERYPKGTFGMPPPGGGSKKPMEPYSPQFYNMMNNLKDSEIKSFLPKKVHK